MEFAIQNAPIEAYWAVRAQIVAKFEKTFPTFDHSKYADGTYISLRTGSAYQLFEAGYHANT